MMDPEAQSLNCSERLTNLIEHLKTVSKNLDTDHPFQAAFKQFLELWHSACSLKQLDRFLDETHKPFTAYPLPDGSNIPHAVTRPEDAEIFQRQWDFRHLLVRLLHLKGLLFFEDEVAGEVRLNTDYAKAFATLYLIARILLGQELFQTNRAYGTPHHTADSFEMRASDPDSIRVTWLLAARTRIRQMLEDIGARASQLQDNRTPGDRNRQFRDKNNQRAQAGIPPFTPDEELQHYYSTLGLTTTRGSFDRNLSAQGISFLSRIIQVRLCFLNLKYSNTILTLRLVGGTRQSSN